MATIKAYAYLRVSSKGQMEGHGFDRQLEAVDAFCNKSGYKIEHVYREAVSGIRDETERSEFSAMVSEILKNGVRTVIIESLDRLAREYRIQEQLLIYLAAKGITLIAANTGEDITKAISDDPMKKALIQIQGIFAELDKSLLVRKLRKARERVKQERGKCEGRKSYLESNPELIKLIKKLRHKPRGGKKRKTYAQVAEAVNEQGHLNDNGKPFTGDAIKMIMYRHQRKTK